ncbi:MAG: hypothetical protein EOO17_03865 [Chloroflexi bacterium]|nr:MAG: hypothetical protein EOO17_03865 [Chloroflexota bacterium]
MNTPMQLRGVNLGGWLLLERWMTPSLFEGITAQDEYQFMRHPDAAARIAAHRKSFITEADFIWTRFTGILGLADHQRTKTRIIASANA